MTKTNIIIYRGYNIEATNYGKLTSVEVIGNYTEKFDDAKEDGIPLSRCYKIKADITKNDKDAYYTIRVHLQDEEWIHMSIFTKYNCKSIDECIEWVKKSIDRYIYRE